MKYIIAGKDDIKHLMESRLEMLRVVNNLPEEYVFSDEMLKYSREYFNNGNQTTVLAIDEVVIGCASMCYIEVMPTFSHPTDKRAHLMSVWYYLCHIKLSNNSMVLCM